MDQDEQWIENGDRKVLQTPEYATGGVAGKELNQWLLEFFFFFFFFATQKQKCQDMHSKLKVLDK
jgi:hypothetical protein